MGTTGDKITEELTRLEKDWGEAIVSNNAEAIGGYMSDDWIIVGTEGGITGKEAFLNFIRSGDLIHIVMDFDSMRIRSYENSAVVTSRGTSSGTYKEQPFSFYEWSTDVWIKEYGEWKCVLTMLTPAVKSK